MELYFPSGTNLQRTYLSGGTYPIPRVGKAMWTTDTKKFYIGDGTTSGGILIGPITEYSGLSNTAHTHDYISPYSSPILDRITATSLTTTGASIHTTDVYVTGNVDTFSLSANTLYVKRTVLNAPIYFEGSTPTTGQLNFTNTYNFTLSTGLTILNSGTLNSPIITGASVSATNYYCGSTNLTSLFGAGGVTDHGALTGLYDNDHPQYRLTASTSPLTATTISATTISATTIHPSGNLLVDGEIQLNYDDTGNARIGFGSNINTNISYGGGQFNFTHPLWLGTTSYFGNDGAANTKTNLYLNADSNFGSAQINFGYNHSPSFITIWGNTASTRLDISSTLYAPSITGASVSATTFFSGNNNLLNVLSPTGHTHPASSITPAAFGSGGDYSFPTSVSFGQAIDGKSAYMLNNVTATTIAASTHMSAGSCLSMFRSGSTDVLIQMGTLGAEIQTIIMDQDAGGFNSKFAFSTGITANGIISGNSVYGATVDKIAGSGASPTYFGTATQGGLSGSLGIRNHWFVDNSEITSVNPAIYYQVTGDTKWGIDVSKETSNDFKIFASNAHASAKIILANRDVQIDNSLYVANSVSALTYSGITVNKGITVPDPRANENIVMFYVDRGISFTKVVGVVSGTSPSVTWSINSATTRTGSTGTITGATTTSQDGVVYNVTPNLFVPANSWIIFKTSATGGTTNNEFHATVYYREL